MHHWACVDLTGWLLLAGWLYTGGGLLTTRRLPFSADPRNEGPIHPDRAMECIEAPKTTFGEILLWLGLYLSASSVFRRTEYLCVLCPRDRSAAHYPHHWGCPRLEQAAFRKWGNDPAYHEYLRSTAVLVPFLW
uniref:Putative steroid reductase ixodes scapularis steroid reductase n=1 Tax=Amblyomma tuberculatum TaxID=48802 RepID=A0A6M2E2N9_9ACAR